MRWISLLLVLAACAEKQTEMHRVPLGAVTRIRVACLKATIEISSEARDDVALLAHAAMPQPRVEEEKGELRIVSEAEGKLSIVVPEDLDLLLFCDYAVCRGAWGDVEIIGRRGVVVEAKRLAGGKITARDGVVDVTTAAGPRRDLVVTAGAGNAIVKVASSYHGSLHIESGLKEIRVGEHEKLWTKPGPNGLTLIGFVGKKPAGAQRARQLAGKEAPPPGIWVRAPRGSANLEVFSAMPKKP